MTEFSVCKAVAVTVIKEINKEKIFSLVKYKSLKAHLEHYTNKNNNNNKYGFVALLSSWKLLRSTVGTGNTVEKLQLSKHEFTIWDKHLQLESLLKN